MYMGVWPEPSRLSLFYEFQLHSVSCLEGSGRTPHDPHILPLTMKFPTNFCQLALTPPPPIHSKFRFKGCGMMHVHCTVTYT